MTKAISILIIFSISYSLLGQEQSQPVQETSMRYSYHTNSKWRIGVKIACHLNIPIIHMTPTISIYKKSHNFFIGPEYTSLTRPFKDADWKDRYEVQSWGFKIGYRYLYQTQWQQTHFYLQLNGSVYEGSYGYSSPGGGGYYEGVIGEITLGFGVNHKIDQHVEIFIALGGGASFSSVGAFDHVLFHSCFGMGYNFGK